SIVVGSTVPVRADPGDPESKSRVDGARARAFDRTASKALALPGFDAYFSLSFDVGIGTKLADQIAKEPEKPLEFRQAACAKVVIVSGRCPAGPGEVIVGTHTAENH